MEYDLTIAIFATTLHTIRVKIMTGSYNYGIYKSFGF